ncbi:hypothetical protein DZ782_12385 [Enterococcus faecium]|nr:hypothetical protein [Enterococcus faecium]
MENFVISLNGILLLVNIGIFLCRICDYFELYWCAIQINIFIWSIFIMWCLYKILSILFI